MLVPFTDSRIAWLLLRKKPKQEHNVVQALHHRTLDAYFPRVVGSRRHPRVPMGPVPSFASYGFVRCDVRSQHSAANCCPSVLRVVRFGGFLAAVEKEFVDLFRSREGEPRCLAVREPPVRGQWAGGLAGPFAGHRGLVEKSMQASDRGRLPSMLVAGERGVTVEVGQIGRGRRL